MLKRRWYAWLLLGMFLSALTACDLFQALPPKKQREERAAEAQGKIVLGIVDSSTVSSLFQQGVKLAVNELNQGKILGRELDIVVFDDRGQIETGRQVAAKLAQNRDVVAVIGHLSDQVALPVSIVYEENGILFLAPNTSDPNFTLFKRDYIFRNTPNGKKIGEQLADFLQPRYKRVVVFYQREDAYRRLTDSFKAKAANLGIELPITRSFFDKQTDFRSVLSEIRNETFDAIMIAGRTPGAAHLIKQARGLGITAPIIGTDGLDSPELWRIAGREAEGTMIVTVFDPEQPNRLTREFVKQFEATYGVQPDTLAAQGYDAVKVLAFAMEQSSATVPIVLSTTLRFLKDNWDGVTGSYRFTPQGDLTEKPIFFKIAQNGSFAMMRDLDAEIPFNPQYLVEDITLRLPLPQEPRTLDPGLVNSSSEAEVMEQLFLGLTSLNPQTYQPEPALAESWTANAEFTTYRFTLRKDVTWTDGQPVTADDVVCTLRHNLNPARQSLMADQLTVLQNAEAILRGQKEVTELGVQALDPTTVEFTLSRPAAYFPALASTSIFRPLPCHFIATHGTTQSDPIATPIPTNGAYTLALWEKGKRIILRRNPRYYARRPDMIAEIRYLIMPLKALALEMYRRQQLDVVGWPYTEIPNDKLPTVKADPGLRDQYRPAVKVATMAYAFNLRQPPMDHLLVRKAIAAAIDRRLILDLSVRGGGSPAMTMTPPQLLGADAPLTAGIPFNPVQARQWLAEAGYPDGRGFPELIIYHEAASSSERSLTALPTQTLLKHYLNIQVTVQPIPIEDYERVLREANQSHLFRLFYEANYPEARNFLYEGFHPRAALNYVGWQNQTFASLLDAAEQSTDAAQRQKLYQQAEQVLCTDEVAVLPYYYQIAPVLVHPRIKNWSFMAFGGQHIRDWTLEK